MKAPFEVLRDMAADGKIQFFEGENTSDKRRYLEISAATVPDAVLGASALRSMLLSTPGTKVKVDSARDKDRRPVVRFYLPDEDNDAVTDRLEAIKEICGMTLVQGGPQGVQ